MRKNVFEEKTAGRGRVPTVAQTVAVIALVLSVYLWYAVLLPQRDLIGQLKNKCETGLGEVSKVESFVRGRPDYESYLTELDGKLDELNVMLPSEPGFSEFLREMEKISREAGVAIFDIKPLAATAKEGWRELAVEIIVRGNFEQFVDFAGKLEGSRRFVSITAASISRKGASGAGKDSPELEGKISLVIYSSR